MNTLFFSLHSWSDAALLASRLALAAIFWVHGRGKAGMWKMQPGPTMPASLLGVFRLLSVLEPLAAGSFVLGLLTPITAACCGILMIGTIRMKMIAWKTPFMANDKTGWELDLVILALAILLLVMGPGAYSLDHLYLGA